MGSPQESLLCFSSLSHSHVVPVQSLHHGFLYIVYFEVITCWRGGKSGGWSILTVNGNCKIETILIAVFIKNC